MAGKLVTVMKFNQHFEAHLAKNYLENEGIPSTVAGELTTETLFGNPVGLGDQIVLQVREEDAQRATGLLAEVAAAKVEDNWEEEAESGADVWICSICGEPISNRLSMCYSCQSPRDGIRAAAPRDRTAIQQERISPAPGEEIQQKQENVFSSSPTIPLSMPPENQPGKRPFPFSMFNTLSTLLNSWFHPRDDNDR